MRGDGHAQSAGRIVIVARVKQSIAIKEAKTLQICLLSHDAVPDSLVVLFQIQNLLRG